MIKNQLQKLIEDAAESLGYSIYESSIYLKGVNTVLTVKIDNLGVVSHSDCEAYSRELSRRIDASETVTRYSIEVSSPGLDRKLRSMDEFARFTGLQVKVVYRLGEGGRAAKGLLVSAGGGMITVEEDGKMIDISIDDVIAANLDF